MTQGVGYAENAAVFAEEAERVLGAGVAVERLRERALAIAPAREKLGEGGEERDEA